MNQRKIIFFIFLCTAIGLQAVVNCMDICKQPTVSTTATTATTSAAISLSSLNSNTTMMESPSTYLSQYYRYKTIQDPIHTSMHFSKLEIAIIDSPQFQRLRKIYQLGTCNHVFPTGNNSRFEHSLGVCHLAGLLMTSLVENSNKLHIVQCISKIADLYDLFKIHNLTEFLVESPSSKSSKSSKSSEFAKNAGTSAGGSNKTLANYCNCKITAMDAIIGRVIQLMRIAGLCHDLGHFAFSHMFDAIVLVKKGHHAEEHEARSGLILEQIVSEKKLCISRNELNFIKRVINPEETDVGFLFQIVSNSLNGIDVDKFDYIVRDTRSIGLKFSYDYSRIIDDAIVMDNSILYPYQCYEGIYNLFATRYNLHNQIYTHKCVIGLSQMWKDILLSLDVPFKFSESIHDMSLFCKWTNASIESIFDLYDRGGLPSAAVQLYDRIKYRDLYKLIHKKVEAKRLFKHSDELMDLLTRQDSSIDKKHLSIAMYKIAYSSCNIAYINKDHAGDDNPMNSIQFYKRIANSNSSNSSAGAAATTSVTTLESVRLEKLSGSIIEQQEYHVRPKGPFSAHVIMVFSTINDESVIKKIKSAYEVVLKTRIDAIKEK